MTAEKLVQRRYREIAEMLVIDGVELAAIDHVPDIGHLERRQAVFLQQRVDSLYEAMSISDVSEDVVTDDQIGALAVRLQLRCQLPREKRGQRGHACCSRSLSLFAGRIDAEHRHSFYHEILEEVAIIARQLDDQAAGTQGQAINQVESVCAGMVEQCL